LEDEVRPERHVADEARPGERQEDGGVAAHVTLRRRCSAACRATRRRDRRPPSPPPRPPR
ncbi:MAG: hypothetical protein ACK55I_48380, partial [bacterium]